MSMGFSTLRTASLCAALTLILSAPSAQAAHSASDTTAEESNDDIGYDTIVRDLSREADRPALTAKLKKPSYDPFSSVLFHGGVGGSILAESLNVGGKDLFINQKGLQVALGIDLFSPAWMAEGTFRSFGNSESQSITTSLQEFELKVYYHERVSGPVGVRFGGGLTGRYLSVGGSGLSQTTYTTPSAVATAALDFFLNDKLSVGTDLSGRTAMISDTPDKNSVDFTLRMDAHF